MGNNEPVPVEAAWAALRNLADELGATHAPPFTVCFFEEYGDAIEGAMRYMINGAPAMGVNFDPTTKGK